MPGRKLSPQLIDRIQQLRKPLPSGGQRSIDQIVSKLEELWPTLSKEETQGRKNPPHRNTVADYTQAYDAKPEGEKAWDLPINWLDLDRFGIPWEASGRLLALWKRETYHPPITQGPLNPHPTARTVKWWWRVMCAATGALDETVAMLAEDFAKRERIAEIAPEENVSYADLWAFIAFRPWSEFRAYVEYLDALKRDREGPTVDWGGDLKLKGDQISGTWIHDPIAVEYGATPRLVELLKWQYVEDGILPIAVTERQRDNSDDQIRPEMREKLEQRRQAQRERAEKLLREKKEDAENG